jgi:4a-hydroxytetrahydrobiopterin dehydratase
VSIATAASQCLSHPTPIHPKSLRSSRRIIRVAASEGGVAKRQEDLGGLGGDIGARDPTAGEIASGFTSTCLGHADTDHILSVPEAMKTLIMLVHRECKSDDADKMKKLNFDTQEVYRKQIWDWKIRPGVKNYECLRREYATGDSAAMVGVIQDVCARNAYSVSRLEAVGEDKVICELGRDEIKGICENDFILAAKIDADAAVTALIVKAAPKKRVWF